MHGVGAGSRRAAAISCRCAGRTRRAAAADARPPRRPARTCGASRVGVGVRRRRCASRARARVRDDAQRDLAAVGDQQARSSHGAPTPARPGRRPLVGEGGHAFERPRRRAAQRRSAEGGGSRAPSTRGDSRLREDQPLGLAQRRAARRGRARRDVLRAAHRARGRQRPRRRGRAQRLRRRRASRPVSSSRRAVASPSARATNGAICAGGRPSVTSGVAKRASAGGQHEVADGGQADSRRPSPRLRRPRRSGPSNARAASSSAPKPRFAVAIDRALPPAPASRRGAEACRSRRRRRSARRRRG